MELFRFYQRKSDKGWLGIKDSGSGTVKRVLDDGGIKLTILALSSLMPETEKEIFYKGPWYADIDCATDIPAAAASVLKLVEKLVSLDVPGGAIQLFASGSKGFHVLVDAKVFSQDRPNKHLPQIYKAMAAKLYVYGMDMSVYRAKQGCSWRLPNVKRDDTATYRVPVLASDLVDITKERYLELVSQPRELPATATVSVAAQFRQLFLDCSVHVETLKPIELVEAPEELAKIRDTLPSCVEMLVAGKTKTEKTFNDVGLQLATYIERVAPSALTVDALVEKTVETYETTTHPQQARRDALTGLLGYIKNTPAYKFSCAGMRSILVSNRCKQCPIYKVDIEADLAKKLGLEEQDDGYYTGTGDSRRRICSFRVELKAVLREYSHEGNRGIRTGAVADIKLGEHKLPEVVIEESTWKNKANFIAAFSGISNLGFYGTDVDVQKIKTLVLAGEDDMSEIVRVYSMGMHVKKVSGFSVVTYVEPNFSVNASGVRDLYMVTGTVPASVDIGKRALVHDNKDKLQKLQKALKLLLQVNSPLVIAKVLGWHCGCHLKVHMRHSGSAVTNYPLLSLHGSAESGKNRTAELFSWLNGCRFGSDQAPFSAPSAKSFPLINLLTTSTTIPRIVDELNVERIGRRNFDWIAEYIKCSWDCTSVPRGTINQTGSNGKGQTSAGLIEQYITAPVIYCSEQAITENTALQQRSVQVHLSAKTREGRTDFYNQVMPMRETLHDFARHMVQAALNTPVDAIAALLDEKEALVPEGITGDRARICFTVLLVGLAFFESNYKQLGLDLDDEYTAVYSALTEYMEDNKEEIMRENQWSNIDSVLEIICIMASYKDDPVKSIIKAGEHFVYDPGKGQVYLNSPLVFALYKQYAHRSGEVALISTHLSFMNLVKQQAYFLSAEFSQVDVFEGAKCLALSTEVMQKRGLHTEYLA